MEALECIETRRSVRKYSEQEVTEDVLRKIVEAACFTPSWKNTQTAGYVAVFNPELKNRIAENDVLGFAYNTKTITRCPVLVAVTSEKNISGYEKDGSFTTPMGKHWQSFDAGAAAQTFMLAAHAYGVGTVTLGIFDADKVAADLGLPAEKEVSALIAVGYPVKAGTAPERKSVDELLTVVR